MNRRSALAAACLTGLALTSADAQDSRNLSPMSGTDFSMSVRGSVGVSRERTQALGEDSTKAQRLEALDRESVSAARRRLLGIGVIAVGAIGNYYAQANYGPQPFGTAEEKKGNSSAYYTGVAASSAIALWGVVIWWKADNKFKQVKAKEEALSFAPFLVPNKGRNVAVGLAMHVPVY